MTTTPTPKSVMTPTELSELIGVEEKTLANWRTAGKTGPRFVKVGNRILYRRATVERWLEALERASTSAQSGRTQPANPAH